MTTTFKVVEFYRNNNLSNGTGNENNINTINHTLNGNTVQDQDNNLSNSIYTSFGFSVLGGYSSDLPITIVDLAPSSNGKPIKVKK